LLDVLEAASPLRDKTDAEVPAAPIAAADVNSERRDSKAARGVDSVDDGLSILLLQEREGWRFDRR
jgi:hypothetical protein